MLHDVVGKTLVLHKGCVVLSLPPKHFQHPFLSKKGKQKEAKARDAFLARVTYVVESPDGVSRYAYVESDRLSGWVSLRSELCHFLDEEEKQDT